MRLAHTQGQDELLSEILQPFQGSNSRASLAFSVLQPHFAGIVKRRSESDPVSGADSASVQEQLVKGSLSSSNFNIVDELEEVDLDFHKYDYRSGHPAVFVCTYHKYNEGRPLAGMWLDLYTFSCYEDFVAACRWLHRDEQDPEFAYLDYENYCDEWYSESSLDEATFERILEYADLDDDEQEAFRAFLDVTSDSDADFSDFRERYCGRWDSEEEFAQHLADELCMFDNVPESITRFFDFKAFARELFMSDYDMGDGGHVFRTC